MTIHYQSAGRTHIGKVRQRNEDAILVRDDAGLWVVADGLGGHADGDYASRTVVERLAALPRGDSVTGFVASIEETLAGVNADLRRTARMRGVDAIASTVVVLVDAVDCMLCGWAGDSRGYCRTGGRLTQITRDHVRGAWRLPPPPAGSEVMTRCVGGDDVLDVEWVRADNRPGTLFLLCSDGLNKEMSDAEIDATCARHATARAVLGELFEISLGRVAADNISAVVMRADAASGERP